MRWGISLGGLVALAAFGAATAAPAYAAGPVPVVRLVSPHTALVRGDAAVVRARVAAGTRLKALLDGRDVSGRFGPPRGGVRTAKLRVGWKPRSRAATLELTAHAGARQGIELVTLVRAARRDRRYLAIHGIPRRSGHAPLIADLAVRPPLRHLVARLNGRPVSSEFLAGTGGTRRAHLGADDGLRFGRNRLVVTAFDEKGRYDVESDAFVVTRGAPLIAAGDDQRMTVGAPVSLDASRSRPAKRGRVLRYRWYIVRAPRGSKARIRDPRSAKPSLITDTSGRYRVRLKLAEGRPRGGAAQGEEPLEPPEYDLVEPSSTSEDLEIVGAPAVGPIGMGISTIPAGGGPPGVSINGVLRATSTSWIQLVTVARDSGSVVDQAIGDPDTLRTAVDKLGPDSLAIMTAGGRSRSMSSADVAAVEYAYSKLGGTLAPFGKVGSGSDPGFADGDWSLIGIKKLPTGQAWQNSGLVTGEGGKAGSLEGYLQKDQLKNFTFTFGDYVPFDTNSTNFGSESNQMTVQGSGSFDSEVLNANVAAGFHVVVLDQGTLSPVANRTFVVNNSLSQPSAINAMAGFLNGYFSRKQKVVFMINSIGPPWLSDSSWPRTLADAIDRVGGSRDVFNMAVNQLTGGYALIGGTNMPAGSGVETSNIAENPDRVLPIKLAGAFTRNRQSQFRPAFTGKKDGLDVNGSLYALAYQPPQPFPFTGPSDTGQRAAMSTIAQQLGLKEPYISDLRRLYYSEDISATALNTELNNPRFVFFPGQTQCGCTAAEFAETLLEIQQEFDWVVDIDDYLNQVVSPALTQAEIIDSNSIAQVATNIEDEVKATGSSAPVNSDIDTIFAKGVGLSSYLAGAADPVAGAAVSALGGALGLLNEHANTATGASLVEPTQVQATQLGTEILQNYQRTLLSLTHVRDLLVSDYGKLSTAGPLAASPAASGGWQPATTAPLVDALEASTVQNLYEQLMPISFQVYDLTYGGTYATGGQTPDHYKCDLDRAESAAVAADVIYPWAHGPSAGYQKQVTNTSGPDRFTFQYRVLSTNVGITGDNDNEITSEGDLGSGKLLSALFRPVNDPALESGGVGLVKPAFFERAFKNRRVHC